MGRKWGDRGLRRVGMGRLRALGLGGAERVSRFNSE